MGSQPKPALATPSVPSVARIPILTANEDVVGYKLSFQSNSAGQHPAAEIENEASAIIETLNVVGLGVLCDGRRAFIDCTHQMLLLEYFALLPAGIVFEIQDSVPVDDAVIAACRRMKEGGYMIALDNFLPNDAREHLIQFADFIKIDLKRVSLADSAPIIARHGSEKCRALAKNVETRRDFVAATKAGFTRFEGYFFRQNEHLRVRHIPANQSTYLRLLQAVSKPDLDFAEIELLIKHEPSLCYRLLRYLNSPLLGVSSPVLSIRHAFNVLGERELTRWIKMASTLAMGQEKCSDLVLSSLVRARFCELIAPKIKHVQSELYLLGLLSLMDVILEVPMGVVIGDLPLDPDTKAQLLRGKTGERTPLSTVYDLMVAREAGDWGKVTKLGKELDLSLVSIAATYNTAMQWADQLVGTGSHELEKR